MNFRNLFRFPDLCGFSIIIKLIRFGAVGISGMIVDFGITCFLKDVIDANKYFSNCSGFCLAATSNYILNRIWTFNNTDSNVFAQFSKFFAISAMGLLLNTFTLWFLTDYGFQLNFYISKAIATLLVFFWNFLMNNAITFRKQQVKQPV
jgi:putative flippase GtrA